MPTLFLRLLASDDKPAALADAMDRLRSGRECPDAHVVEPESFRQVPGAPFAYWVSDKIHQIYKRFDPLHCNGRSAQKGAYTNDDFRFIRTWWETDPRNSARSKEETFNTRRWVPLAKGGAYARFYRSWDLTIDWRNDGEDLKLFLSEYRGSRGWGYQWSAALNGYSLYFLSGLTWSRRTTSRLSVRVMPKGCIFADKGPTLISKEKNNWAFAGLMNTAPFMALVELQLAAADAAARSYEVGVIQRTPVPDLSGEPGVSLGDLAQSAVKLKRSLDTANETSHVFHLPALLQAPGKTLAERITSWQSRQADADRQLTEIQREIDDIAFRLYGIDGEDRRAIEAGAAALPTGYGDEETEGEDDA